MGKGLATVAAACVVACAQTSTIDYDAGAPTSDDASPDGPAACGTQHVGTTPRPSLQGSTPGSAMANLHFQGYPGGDSSKGLQPVHLCDYYDPPQQKYALIVLSAAALWCGPCNAEADATVQVAPKLAAKKVVFLEVIIEGPSHGTPATQNDLDLWVGRHKNDFTTVIDPDHQLAGFFDPTAIPWTAYIDARSLEILQAGLGFAGDIEGEVQPLLDWVNSHPASY